MKRPLSGCFDNFTLGFTYLCYSVILVLFLVLERDSGDISPKDRHNKLGLACVILILTIVLVNLAFSLLGTLQQVIDIIKLIRAKCKGKPKKSIEVESPEEVKLKLKKTRLANMSTR